MPPPTDRRESPRPLLAAIHAAATAAGLGEHRQRYWWAPAFNVARGGTLLVLVLMWAPATTQNPLSAAATIGCGIATLAVGGPIVAELVYGATQRSHRLDLFEHGLTVSRGTRVRVVRYVDTTVRRRAIEHTRNSSQISYHYTLTDPTGVAVKLTSRFEHPTRWGPAIECAVTEHRLPAALTALAAGQRLEFGVLSATAAGFTRGRHTLRWTDILSVHHTTTVVRFTLRNRFTPIGIKIRRVPDVRLFIALAQHQNPGLDVVDSVR